MSSKFHVYEHYKEDSGEIFYVGKGTRRRAYETKKGRSVFWKNTYKKHGLIVKIVAEGLTDKRACDLEISLIRKYGRKDNGTGCLVNLTDGGDSTAGRILSEKERRQKRQILTRPDVKKKAAQARQIFFETPEGKRFLIGRKETLVSYNKSEEGREEKRRQMIGNKNSLGRIIPLHERKQRSLSNIGKKRSDETKEKLANSKTGSKNPNYNPTKYRWVQENGKKEYNTINYMTKKYNLRRGSLSSVRDGKKRQSGGWFFEKVRDVKTQKEVAKYRENKRGLDHPLADRTVYKFVHKNGIVEHLTRHELAEKYSFKVSRLGKLFCGERASVFGWYLNEVKLRY